MTDYLYPSEIVEEVIKRWDLFQGRFREKPPFPDRDTVRKILDVVYHASLLTEESRRVNLRVVYLPQNLPDKQKRFINANRSPIKFAEPITFDINELLRLAPSVEATKSMIAVYPTDAFGYSKSESQLMIWGILHLGSEWWRLVTGKESAALCPPNCFTVSSFAPGSINVSSSGQVLCRLQNGALLESQFREMSDGCIGSFFQDATTLLYKDICKKLKIKKYSTEADVNRHPSNRYFQTWENIIKLAREHHHGATFIVLPMGLSDSTSYLYNKLSIKYRLGSLSIWDKLIEEGVSRHNYYKYLFPDKISNKRLTMLTDSKNASAEDLKALISWEEQLEAKEELIAEFADFISSLSSVDGAVVLTKKFEVLGFGAEIIVEETIRDKVRKSKDSMGAAYQEIPMTSYGTRHRSAMRLCSVLDDSMCFVISKDGPVRAIKKMRSEVYIWDNIDIGELTL